MLKNDILLKELNDLLTFHVLTTKNLSKGNLNDQAVLSEGLCVHLANILFGLSLENVNKGVANADTIDLRDADAGVAVQVTVREDREKIDLTISNFISKGYCDTFDTLYILILGYKPSYKKPFDLQGKLTFDEKKNILSIPEIILLAENLHPEKLQQLVEGVKAYLLVPEGKKLSKAEHVEELWLGARALHANAVRAVVPDFLGRISMDPDRFYHLALQDLARLEDLNRRLPLSVSAVGKDSINKLMKQSIFCLDAIRIFKQYFIPPYDNTNPQLMQYWSKADQAVGELNSYISSIEAVLRDELA